MIQKEYVTKGYNLMMSYISDNRIKTKNRNFVRRLENFYKKNNDKDLKGGDDLKYLELELHFFTKICEPRDNKERALVEVLKLTIKKEKQLGEME